MGHIHTALLTNKKSGFTLVELLVSIGIIGVLFVGLGAALNPIAQLQKSRDAKRIQELKQIQNALELYYQDHGKYPTQTGDFRIRDADSGTTIDFGGTWAPYMSNVPDDPSGKEYRYYSDNALGNQTYRIYASLDRNENTCSNNKATVCPNVDDSGIASNACGGICNYGATSMNTSP